MALFAGGIKTDPGLSASLGAIGNKQGNTIGNVYSRIRNRAATEATAPTMRPSPYLADRLGTAEDFSQKGLSGALEGVLGDTSYKDSLAERDYQQNIGLAKRIGDLNKPSLMQEILGGLSGGAKAGGGFASLYQALGQAKGGSGAPSFGTASNPYGQNLDDILNSIRGYQEYPNELRR